MLKKNLLLVDDEVDFAETMALRLGMRGYEVNIAHNGEEALEKAKGRPDLILIDVMMPIMDGYQLCSRLRQDKKTKNIPIIMLTAKKTPQDKIEGLQIGADDYISKSFDLEELFARIEALLRRSGRSEEVEQDKALLAKELREIIKNESVEIVFQPIVYLEPRRLFAYEVLTRGPENSQLHSPEDLFKCALNYGMLPDLEIVCRKKALAKIGKLIEEKLFFVNTSPCLIESDRLKEILALYKNPEQIVLEIVERSEIKDFSIFCKTVNSIKARGFKISIDDVGSGYSSLDTIAALEPDFVKIDMAIVRDIHLNPTRQNLIKAIMFFCNQDKIVPIGEGIETEDEMKSLISLGVEVGQGYFLGRPRPQLEGNHEKKS